MYYVLADVIDPESGEVIAEAGDQVTNSEQQGLIDWMIAEYPDCLYSYAYSDDITIVDRYEADTVDADSQCPNCHENRTDYLGWSDDKINCITCGCTYTL